MYGGRSIIIIAGLSTLATLAGVDAGYDYPRARVADFHPHRDFYCDPPRAKITDERMTKREHREMMQRDFARGGNRPGRRRKNRMEGKRWKS